MTTTLFRSSELLSRTRSRLVVIDMQERMLAVMSRRPELMAACRLLIEGARLLSVPMAATEQYPRGLGPTVAELRDLLPQPQVKQEFSSAPCLAWPTAAELSDGRHQIVLAGVESHVCVLQTAFDLQAAGYRVFVVSDAVASRFDDDRNSALARMRDAGLTVVTAESVVFEWCETAAAPEFKELSKLVKARPR